jgi:molybdenum cofactor cytidylyltransferase
VAARDVIVVPEASAAIGMGDSIAAGVAARAASPGWLLLPGDMPLVRPATILAVAAALEQHPVAYAQHHGRRGHPVGFAAELYSELMMLRGDEGARRIVARYPAIGVDVDDAGVLMDVDTEADLATLRALGAADGARSGAQPGSAPAGAVGAVK